MADRYEGDDAAVMVGGGIDSAVLAIELLKRFRQVHPIYIRCGLRWESQEFAGITKFLEAASRPGLMPLSVLEEPIADVYGSHWSTTGVLVPSGDTPDNAVYLPGRNLLLVSKAAIWCRLRDFTDLALGSLASNPFPDSTPNFYRAFETVLDQALASRIRILRPYESLHKADVVRRGAELPLWLTFSCLSPVNENHCGRCNKCVERHRGFVEANVLDRTIYASKPNIAIKPKSSGRHIIPCIE